MDVLHKSLDFCDKARITSYVTWRLPRVSFQVIRISQDSLSLLFVKCQQSALENNRIAEYLTEHHF